MKKSIALATLIGLLLAGIVFQHYITGLPDLESPVRIEEARFNAQTGSIFVRVVDNQGDAFSFGLRASEDFEREVFPVFYMRNPDVVPYMYWPNIGGPDERAFLRLLEGWIERNVAPDLRQRLEQGGVDGLAAAEQEIAAVYQVYTLVRERHQR
ncbi:MAG TPA: hypothetical protein VGP45_05505 [Marinobacter sp.]|nr:hypothetical protein [Marinobacter sp.]